MKVPTLRFPQVRRGRAEEPPGIVAAVRLDVKTKVLVKRLLPGEIALIDHADLDRVSADELIACKVAAVVNAAKSITGRYPNLGPRMLLDAGIPLVDDVGAEVFAKVTEGTSSGSTATPSTPTTRSSPRARCRPCRPCRTRWARPRRALPPRSTRSPPTPWSSCAASATCSPTGSPSRNCARDMKNRHVLVVARGYRYQEDLRTLRPYIREFRPVMLAVDGGAEALLDAGYRPNMIIGDMDSVTDEALVLRGRTGRPRVRGRPRARPGQGQRAWPGPHTCAPPGTSEDVALLLADALGASLIAVVGTHWSAGGVPRKGPSRHVQHVSHPPAGGRQGR